MSKEREGVVLTCVVFSICAFAGYEVGTHHWFLAVLCAVYCIARGCPWVVRRVRRADELESWVQRREDVG